MSSEQEVKQSFIVEIEQVIVRRFTVDDVNSPEEAEQMAEDMLIDGEVGEILTQETTNLDSYPAYSKEDIS